MGKKENKDAVAKIDLFKTLEAGTNLKIKDKEVELLRTDLSSLRYSKYKTTTSLIIFEKIF